VEGLPLDPQKPKVIFHNFSTKPSLLCNFIDRSQKKDSRQLLRNMFIQDEIIAPTLSILNIHVQSHESRNSPTPYFLNFFMIFFITTKIKKKGWGKVSRPLWQSLYFFFYEDKQDHFMVTLFIMKTHREVTPPFFYHFIGKKSIE